MLDPTRLCNLALSFLGELNLVSLNDDDSRVAEYCRNNYDPSRRSVLTEREWTFAVRRVVITLTTETPPFGEDYRYYTIPTDVLRVINVLDSNYRPANYTREGRRIFTDHYNQNLFITYTADVTDTSQLSDLFDQAHAAHIARNIAIPLTGDKTLLEGMATLYQDNLNRATSSDALQGSREMLERSRMEVARHYFVPLD